MIDIHKRTGFMLITPFGFLSPLRESLIHGGRAVGNSVGQGTATYKISNGTRTRVVHANWLWHCYQPLNTTGSPMQPCPGQWEPYSVMTRSWPILNYHRLVLVLNPKNHTILSRFVTPLLFLVCNSHCLCYKVCHFIHLRRPRIEPKRTQIPLNQSFA